MYIIVREVSPAMYVLMYYDVLYNLYILYNMELSIIYTAKLGQDRYTWSTNWTLFFMGCSCFGRKPKISERHTFGVIFSCFCVVFLCFGVVFLVVVLRHVFGRQKKRHRTEVQGWIDRTIETNAQIDTSMARWMDG